MEHLKSIKQCLVSQVQGQCGDLKKVNAKELGEVIDMIKDLEEAMYYCAITEAMEESKEEKNRSTNQINYYMEPYDDGGRSYHGRAYAYYDDNHHNDTNTKMYVPYMEYAPYMMRDDKWREDHMPNSRSDKSRRMYMEGKEKHTSTDVQAMKDLETYVKDLTDDVLDMIKESTPEEKQVLSSKLQTLASKVNK